MATQGWLRLWPLVMTVGAFACGHSTRVATPAEAPRVQVMTADGPLLGRELGREQNGVRVFLGVPFASPPVGPLRWRPPQPVPSWTAPRAATRRASPCPQLDKGHLRSDSSEDCLTLNVWAPAAAGSGERLPVLFWIHGGAFIDGSGADPLYDGALLAARAHAVVVTVNYRLGPLGFLSHRQLAAEAGLRVSPSLGILDQRAALQWVQRNAAAFGGDPASVTIFGQSAGAFSVCTHLASPGSRGLFARAIMESGACSDLMYFDAETATAQADALAAAVGCTGAGALVCLRAQPVEAILRALPLKRNVLLSPGVWWGPVVDGVELPRVPLAALRAGEFARVPLLLGWNRDEGALHTLTLPHVTAPEVEDFARTVFGPEAASALPSQNPGATPQMQLRGAVTDGVLACNDRRVARAVTAHGVRVFLYEMTHALDDPRPHPLGATHTVELWFVFGNADKGVALSAAERPLSHLMMDAWGRFARTGDPGSPALNWPRYSFERQENLVLDTVPSIATRTKQDVCDVWDRFDRLGSQSRSR